MKRPEVLIEQWLPTTELGIESVRERAAASALPPLYFLHVWWARRPLVASAGAVLASLLPAWSEELVEWFPDSPELASEKSYHTWFLRLCGILGDPVVGKARIELAKQTGERLPDGGYGYRQAYKNSPSNEDLALLHEILRHVWQRVPNVLDPTAGGGSIPFEAVRYGLPVHANDLNSIAAAVLRAGVELPAKFSTNLVGDLEKWGGVLSERIEDRLASSFALDDPSERVVAYIWARSVTCPRTGKPVPLAPNWWLDKKKGGVAVRLVVERNGVELGGPEFEIVRGRAIDKRAADSGTISRGEAVSPWDHQVIDGDYIKAEARAGRMGSILYAVAVRGAGGRGFRLPNETDLSAIEAAGSELKRLLPRWESNDVIPNEHFPHGNDMRPVEYGMPRWRDMFSPRQLLTLGTFVEEFRKLIPEVRESAPAIDRADAILALLSLIQGKAVNWNASLSSWNVGGQSMRSVFDRHDFSFKWTFAEFEGARALYPWCLSQIVDSYQGVAKLMQPSAGDLEGVVRDTGEITVSKGNAGDLSLIDGSVELICIDPPYYDNVMYAELADFFYVWEKRTLSHLWPELFIDELTDKEQEAVANPARFEHAGRRKKQLATLDYERKMTAIFAESRRVLSNEGVMTVMFTHKKAEAWDTLGKSLLEAGFTIEASWPVPTEREHSLHQAKKNSAASTIFLVCRKREPAEDASRVFFDSIEGEVRSAARESFQRFTELGITGVDLLLATYGPALSVLSDHWPVYSSEPGPDGQSRLLRPEEALDVAREEVIHLQRNRLVSDQVEFDPFTDWWLLAWDTFEAREFPFDEARKLALAVSGVDVDDLARAKIVGKKSGTVEILEPKGRRRRGADSELPGVNVDRTHFPVLIDALHTALYVLDLDGVAAAKSWLEQRRLVENSRFRSLVEAGVRAIPRKREKGELVVDEAHLLERLVVAAFTGIEIPEPDATLTEGQQSLDV